MKYKKHELKITEEELKKRRNLFFNIYTKWNKLLIKTIDRSLKFYVGREIVDDILSDFLVWFQNIHAKFFIWNWEGDYKKGDVNKNRYNRARNYMVQRILFFLSSSSSTRKKIRRIYGLDFEKKYGYNMWSERNAFESICYSGVDMSENNSCGMIYRYGNNSFNGISQIDSKVLDNFCKKLEEKNRLDDQIYLRQLMNFINNYKIYGPTKEKLKNYVNQFFIDGYIHLENLNKIFGSSTLYYRNILVKIIKNFNNISI